MKELTPEFGPPMMLAYRDSWGEITFRLHLAPSISPSRSAKLCLVGGDGTDTRLISFYLRGGDERERKEGNKDPVGIKLCVSSTIESNTYLIKISGFT